MRKCRAARHFKGIKVFQHHRKGEKGWKEFDAIEEEGLLDEEGGYKGIPRRCDLLAFIVGFFVLFTFFALILWGASRNQKPIVTVKTFSAIVHSKAHNIDGFRMKIEEQKSENGWEINICSISLIIKQIMKPM
ncbi:hypothetical protein Adt_00279 [Abeliophyllum distichum]|uniref:Uncharacterized protein n=1 Tax=Abeliophyllum distichum TaxID=126358 RepID=A0ABD1VPX2_9LAMI